MTWTTAPNVHRTSRVTSRVSHNEVTHPDTDTDTDLDTDTKPCPPLVVKNTSVCVTRGFDNIETSTAGTAT